MSVIVYLAAVNDQAADGLVAEPASFQRYMLGGELLFENAEERAAYYRQGLRPKSLRDATPPPTADMDKAWAAIHYLLSKQGNSVLQFLEAGGREIRLPRKRGAKQGPLLARAFSAAEVLEIHRALMVVTDGALMAAYDPEELNVAGVYPENWEPDGIHYVLAWLARARAFLQDRTEHAEGILVGVS